MKKYLLLVGLLPCAGLVHAQGETDYPSVKNAAAIVDAIRSKAELKAVRRQNIWHNSRRRVAECEPRLGLMFRRRACDVASADVRVSFA